MKANIRAIIVGVIITAATVQAHHSGAMFDPTTTVELKGTIKEFQWKNPHVWIQVIARNGDATTKEWSIEGGGPNSLSRDGWRPSTFKPGDEVTMKVHPMRDGSPAGNFIAAKWADGHTLGTWQ